MDSECRGEKAQDEIDERSLAAHFQFGRNWQNLMPQVDEARVEAAVSDIAHFMPCKLTGLSFLDIGCGSGLSSLAAYRLGASSIVSVDIDPLNVENVKQLKRMFAVPSEFPWVTKVASIVNPEEAAALPRSDLVYAWGVLHHTGDMWHAIQACGSLVSPGGYLYLMLYRDAWLAPMWRLIKGRYTGGGALVRFMLRNVFAALLVTGMLLKAKNPLKVIDEYGKRSRGMSWYVDVTDWVGGYPF